MKQATEQMLSVPALAMEQSPGREIYAFGLNGKDVTRFAAVTRARRGDDIRLVGYQRPEVQAHIALIQEYVQSEGSMMPNAVVLAFSSRVRFEEQHQREVTCASRTGILHIPLPTDGEEKVGFIVDGQQRLAAIRQSSRESFPLFVVAFVANDEADQREQFMLVNATKPLPKGLIHELLPGISGHLPPHLAKRKLPAEIVAHLNHTPNSPLEGAIRTATNPTGRIADNSMLRVLETSLSDGVLWEIAQLEEGDAAVELMCSVLMEYWWAVRDVWTDIWELKPRKSRLLHGAGVVTLGYLMEEIIARQPGQDWPDSEFFASQLELIYDDCRWTEGWWDFGGGVRRRWDEIQNINRDVMMLMNHLTRLYRLRSRGWGERLAAMP